MSRGEATSALGARMVVRLARRWGGSELRAVALLRRGDSLAYKRSGVLLRLGEEVLSWPAGGVAVSSVRGRGKRSPRVVEISAEGETLRTLAPGRSRRQREALELIERVTGG